MNAFVTVGTTEFNEFIESVCSESFADAVVSRGIHSVTVQIGRGRFRYPKSAISDTEEFDTNIVYLNNLNGKNEWNFRINVEGHRDVLFDVYRFKPSLEEDIRKASLVISHAGAGSIFESLRAKKPLIVVINTSLANNHQWEIAEALGVKDGIVPKDFGQKTSSSLKRRGSISGSGGLKDTISKVELTSTKKALKPYLFYCECSNLSEVVKKSNLTQLGYLPPADHSLFLTSLKKVLG